MTSLSPGLLLIDGIREVPKTEGSLVHSLKIYIYIYIYKSYFPKPLSLTPVPAHLFFISFLFSGILLWLLSTSNTLKTYVFVFYNFPILLVLAPNFGHSWLEATNILCKTLSWMIFLKSPFQSFHWQLSCWSSVSCHSARWIGSLSSASTLF